MRKLANFPGSDILPNAGEREKCVFFVLFFFNFAKTFREGILKSWKNGDPCPFQNPNTAYPRVGGYC